MSTTYRSPAEAACAATAWARLPVDAQATVLNPYSRAADKATDTTRSLNEWVGLALSSLTHSERIPSSAARRPAGRSGVQPAPSETRVAGSCPAGRRAAYLHKLRGPASIASRVTAASACSA